MSRRNIPLAHLSAAVRDRIAGESVANVSRRHGVSPATLYRRMRKVKDWNADRSRAADLAPALAGWAKDRAELTARCKAMNDQVRALTLQVSELQAAQANKIAPAAGLYRAQQVSNSDFIEFESEYNDVTGAASQALAEAVVEHNYNMSFVPVLLRPYVELKARPGDGLKGVLKTALGMTASQVDRVFDALSGAPAPSVPKPENADQIPPEERIWEVDDDQCAPLIFDYPEGHPLADPKKNQAAKRASKVDLQYHLHEIFRVYLRAARSPGREGLVLAHAVGMSERELRDAFYAFQIKQGFYLLPPSPPSYEHLKAALELKALHEAFRPKTKKKSTIKWL